MQHDAQAEGERWVPLAEAARTLGISVDTLRRRIKRGELREGEAARRITTPQGFAWEVRLDAARPSSSLDGIPAEAPPTRAHPAAEAGHLAALLRETQAEALRQSQAAAMWQARAEMLGQQLEQTQQELRALKAPEPEPVEGPAVATQDVETSRRAWWRFW